MVSQPKVIKLPLETRDGKDNVRPPAINSKPEEDAATQKTSSGGPAQPAALPVISSPNLKAEELRPLGTSLQNYQEHFFFDTHRLGMLVLIITAIIGNLIALKLAVLVGYDLIWSVLVAAGLVALFYTLRRRDLEDLKWQTIFNLLNNRTSRVITNPCETADWLNAVLRSAWLAALPSLQPKATEVVNTIFNTTPLSFPLKSIRCTDFDLSDAIPAIVQVSPVSTRYSNQTLANSLMIGTNYHPKASTSWLSFFGFRRHYNRLVTPAVRHCQMPTVVIDADIVLNTTTSQAWFIAKMTNLPVEVTIILHAMRMLATVRLFCEFNHSLAFPHIARLNATFLEAPEIKFDVKTSQHINVNQVPFLSAILHAHLIKYITRNVMYPDCVNILSNPVTEFPFSQRHIYHPVQQFNGLLNPTDVEEQFYPAVGVLIVDTRVIPRTQSPLHCNRQKSLHLLSQTTQQPTALQCWLVLQLVGQRRYEQIEVVRNSVQMSTGKFAFLVSNTDSEHLRIEAWTKRNSLVVKNRQITIRSSEIFKTANLQVPGPNQIELQLPQWDSLIHLVTTYVRLDAIPLLSLLPTTSDSFTNAPEVTFNSRRGKSKGVTLLEAPGNTPTANVNFIGGVLFVRLRNLKVPAQQNDNIRTDIRREQLIYAVITLNGEILACSKQHHLIANKDANTLTTTAIIHQLEIVIPTPPKTQVNAQELEFAADLMLNNSPIKALHSYLGSATFLFKLPSQNGSSVNSNSKSLQIPISRSGRRTKTDEEQQGNEVLGTEFGHISVDIHFRPVNGLEDLNNDQIKALQPASLQEVQVASQQLLAANDFYEITLIGATELRLPNPNSLGDLFAKVKLNDRVIFKTRVKPSTQDPSWNEMCRLPNLTEWDRVVIEVWDYDFMSKSNFVGHVTLTGDQVLANSVPATGPSIHHSNTLDPMVALQQQQLQQPPCSIWLPFAESNGQLEIIIVFLQTQQSQLRRYSGSQSTLSPNHTFRLNSVASISPVQSPVFGDLHLVTPFSVGTDVFNNEVFPPQNNKQSSFNRSVSTSAQQSPHRQSFGSIERLASSSTQHDRRVSTATAFHSFSADNLDAAVTANSLDGLKVPQLQQAQPMLIADDYTLLAEQQLNKLPLLEATLLSFRSNVRVSLIVCLLEVRGNICTLWRSSAGRFGIDRYAHSQRYITVKVSKKGTARTFDVFSTTLAKSRPLPVLEPPPDSPIAPTVVSNITFQLLDMRLDGVVKITVTPLEIISAAAALASSANVPVLGRMVESQPNAESISSTAASKTYAPPLSGKPSLPLIDWSCDVRELLTGGQQEFDPVMMSQQQQTLLGSPVNFRTSGASRLVRFAVSPPDINFVFRVTQIPRAHHINSKPSSSTVSAAVNARRYGSLYLPPEPVVITPPPPQSPKATPSATSKPS